MISEYKLQNDGYAQVIISPQERCIYEGNSYRVGTGYISLTTGQYASINLVTPPNGISAYSFSIVDKTGAECTITLVEGDTYTGGSNTPLWNINRIVGDSNPPFICKTGGTTTGGINAPIKLLPGTGSGASKPGGTTESPVSIILKPDTSYTLKITALGTVTLAAIVLLNWKI